MAKTKNDTNPAPRQLELLTGVNFTAEGEKETRIEAGTIDDGILPVAFQTSLIERELARFIN